MRNPLYRVWLAEEKQMIDANKCLLRTDGQALLIKGAKWFDGKLSALSMEVREDAYVMMSTGHKVRAGKSALPLYELDIVEVDGKLGIVYYAVAEAGYWIWWQDGDRGYLSQYHLALRNDYFQSMRDNPDLLPFIASIPENIRPDKRFDVPPPRGNRRYILLKWDKDYINAPVRSFLGYYDILPVDCTNLILGKTGRIQAIDSETGKIYAWGKEKWVLIHNYS